MKDIYCPLINRYCDEECAFYGKSYNRNCMLVEAVLSFQEYIEAEGGKFMSPPDEGNA